MILDNAAPVTKLMIGENIWHNASSMMIPGRDLIGFSPYLSISVPYLKNIQ